MADNELMTLTADIVTAHLGNNTVAVNDVPNLIEKVYASLSSLGTAAPEAEQEKQAPAVSIRSSVKPDYIVCLEDGAKLTMLKRYLRTKFDMTPEQYRAKWNLPRDYPMVAPNYAEKRRNLAHAIGLGRKAKGTPAAEAKAPAKRGRKPKAAAELPAAQDSQAGEA